jgi:iron complex transport system permease protein
LLLVAALFSAVIGSLCIGAYPLSFGKTATIVLHLIWPSAPGGDAFISGRDIAVVQLLRLQRVLLATFSGIALGLSGASLQGVMRNPLVGPDLVGVSAGAACGGAVAILFDAPPTVVVILAFCGGLTAMICSFGLAGLSGNRGGLAVILAGIFVGAFFTSCVGLAQFLANDAQITAMMVWLLGTFARSAAETQWIFAAVTVGVGAVLMKMRWRFNLLSLGDLDCQTIGVNIRHLRWVILSAVCLLVAAQVSVSGVIAWVGLIVPHAARMLVGPDHRRLLPASALLGGLFTLGIDDFVRTVLRNEVPIGVMTALIGTPIIAFLFWKVQAKGWNNG